MKGILAVKSDSNAAANGRLYFLDGLRGLGSVIVLFFHMFPCFLMPSSSRTLGRLLDGGFAVKLFFILSGFSLAIGYFRKELNGEADILNDYVLKKSLARYYRLAIPCLGACFIVFVMSLFGVNYYKLLPDTMRIEWFAWAYDNTNVSLWSFLKFSLYDIFFQHPFIPTEQYTGVYYITNLWTMSVEFYGSLLIFFLLWAFGTKQHRLSVFLILFVFFTLFSRYYSFFIAGLILAELFATGRFEPMRGYVRHLFLPVFIVVFGFVPPGQFGKLDVLYCSLLLYLVMYGSWSRALFETRLFRFLGKISFSLYLVHIPVIISVQSYAYLQLKDSMPLQDIQIYVGVAGVILSFVAAHFFYAVDKLSINVSHKVSGFVMNMKTR